MSDCPPTRDEVCGSDKVTYFNDCALRVQACQKGEDITVDNLGPCGKLRSEIKFPLIDKTGQHTLYYKPEFELLVKKKDN